MINVLLHVISPLEHIVEHFLIQYEEISLNELLEIMLEKYNLKKERCLKTIVNDIDIDIARTKTIRKNKVKLVIIVSNLCLQGVT